MNIKYIVGDATSPIGNGKKLICHCNNDKGGWGRGFVLALSKKWPEPEQEYRKWYKSGKNFELGNIQGVRVGSNIAIINMIAQENTHAVNGVPPIRYDAMRKCFGKVAKIAKKYNASVHIPYLIGCDLAGGKWDVVEKIIQEELCDNGIEVTAYDINNKRGT